MTPELRAHARVNLGAFHLAINPQYGYVNFQQRAIVPALHAVARHEIEALMILMPFRHGKTELGTLSFVPWLFGKYPERKNMVLSYSDDFAKEFGGKILETMQSDTYQEIFPDTVLSRPQTSQFFKTTARGEFRSAGFNGRISGVGVSGCLVGETEIATEIGPMRLDCLIQLIDRPRVLSYNHMTGQTEYRAVLAGRQTAEVDRLVEIRTDGASVFATGDHQFATESGYEQAALLTTGRKLFALTPSDELSRLRSQDFGARTTLPFLLWQDAPRQSQTYLCAVWNWIRALAFRVRESITQGRHAGLLEDLRSLARFAAKQRQASASATKTLRPYWSQASAIETIGSGLFSVWRSIRKVSISPEVLLTSLCGLSTFSAYAGGGQFQISEWAELREAVRRYEAMDSRAGRPQVRGLSCGAVFLSSDDTRTHDRAVQFTDSPYQRETRPKSAGKPDHALQDLPCDPSQVETVAIRLVRGLRSSRVPVYDITVDGNHNFFANGLLVHNCLVIDDPLKNYREATSPAIIKARMEDYHSAANLRLEKASKLLITNRWCKGDFVDRVLDMEGEASEGGQWTVLRLAAEAEEGDPLGREPGQYLWPEERGVKWYETHKKGPRRIWTAMCQQAPESERGRFFKRDWLCFYPKQIRPGKFPAYMLTDPATGKDAGHDRTAIGVFVTTPDRRILLVDAALGRYDPDERAAECFRLLKKWQPRKWLYEEYGLLSDTWYLNERRKKEGINIKPIPVGRKGPRHMLSKESRIESLIPDFREGRIWLPDIYGDKEENRPPVYFPTMVNDADEEVSIVEYLIEDELTQYAGDDSIDHEDFLDMMSRLHEPELALTYPSGPAQQVARTAEYNSWSRSRPGLSWESNF